MPKRAARRPARRPSTRTARSSGMPGAESTRRWWNRITKTILTLGALAGAIAAILSLRPSPDPEDSARFTAVHVTSRVPLSEYRQRSAAMVPQGSRREKGRQRDRGALAQITEPDWAANDKSPAPAGPFAVVRRLQPDPTTSSPTDPNTDTSAPEPSSPDTTASSSTATSTMDTATTATSTTDTSTLETAGPPATPDAGVLSSSTPFVVPSELKQEDVRKVTTIAFRRAKDEVPGCDPNLDGCEQIMSAMGVGHALDLEGNPVAPGVAAERVIKVLKDARTTRRKEPLGVVVSVDVELAGLRGKPVFLSWSMWQQSGDTRLYGKWLNRNLAYRLEATTDRDTTTFDLWVPLPKPPGPYFIRIQLTANGSARASTDSQPFD